MAFDYDCVFAADIHLGNTSGAGEVDDKGINSFLYIKERVFNEIIDAAAKNKSILILGGDTLDSPNIDPATAKVFNSCLSRIIRNKVTTLILPGNHESDGLRNSICSYSELKLTGIVFVENTDMVLLNGIEFYCVPYTGKTIEQQNAMVKLMISRAAERKSNGKKKILLLHYPIVGCAYDSGSSVTSGFNLRHLVADDNPFDRIFAGDFHDRQGLSGVDNFLYLGQPYQADFSAAGKDRGYTLYNSKTDKMKLVIPKGCPQFVELKEVTKASDITQDLTNCIVKVFADHDVDMDAIYNRCYKDLNATKVLIRRKRKAINMGDDKEEYKYNADRDSAIATFAKTADIKGIKSKQIARVGIDALREVRLRCVEATETPDL